MQLNERIHKIVRRVLNEELGINDEVYNASNQILNLIRQDIENNNNFVKSKNSNISATKGSFNFPFMGTSIYVEYKSFVFNTLEEYQAAKKENPKELCNASSWCGGVNGSGISVVYNRTIDNGYDESIRDRIQHELDHVFKSIKIDGNLTSNGGLGNKVYNVLHNKCDKSICNDKDMKRIAYLLYYSKKYEQDAYGNGLYNWLMNTQTSPEDVINQSGIMKNINKLRMHIDYLKQLYNLNDKSIYSKVKKYYGISLGSIINKGEIALERTKKIINRIIFKYAKETGKRININI